MCQTTESITLDFDHLGIATREDIPFWIGVAHSSREGWWSVLDLDGAIHLFTKDGRLLRSWSTGTGPMNWGDIHISESGRWLALFHQPKDVGVYRKILLWDLTQDTEPMTPLILGEDEHVHQVITGCFSPDESTFFEGGGDGWINVWGLPHGNLIHRLRGHRMGVMGMSLSPDSRNLASCSHDGTIRLWHVETGRELCRVDVGDSLRKIAFSSDGKTLAVTGGPDLFDQRWIQLIRTQIPD